MHTTTALAPRASLSVPPSRRIAYPLKNLFEAFDNVDAEGNLTFTIPGTFLYPPDTTGKHNIATQLVAAFFIHQPVLMLRFRQVKSFAKDVIQGLTKVDDNTWSVKVNFSKLLLLPEQVELRDLQELRAFFHACSQFMTTDPTHEFSLQICNNRSSSGKVYASIHCHTHSTDPSDIPCSTEVAQAHLENLVAKSPCVQEYLRQIALTLGKVGPWSWVSITENQLFGYNEGPAFSHRLNLRRVERITP